MYYANYYLKTTAWLAPSFPIFKKPTFCLYKDDFFSNAF